MPLDLHQNHVLLLTFNFLAAYSSVPTVDFEQVIVGKVAFCVSYL